MTDRNLIYSNKLIGNLILICFFLIETTRKAFQSNIEITHVAYTLKAIIVSVFLVVILWRKKTRIFYVILILLSLFLLGQFSISNLITVDILKVFTRYTFPLILFSIYNQLPKEDRGHMFIVFERIILLNSILIIVGFIFNIDVFKTYTGQRFGYNGLFYASATGSYIYIFYIINIVDKTRKQIKTTFLDYVPIIACMAIGTKTIYLALILALLYITYINFIRYKFKNLLWLLLIAFTGILIFVKFSHFLFKFYDNNNLITFILSRRDLLFTNNTLPFVDNFWGILNYFFGGLDTPCRRAQMSFIDLFITFGIFGTFLYLWSYINIYFDFKLCLQVRIYYFIIAIIAFLAGNFFLYTFTQLGFLILKDQIIKNRKIVSKA